MDDNGQSNDAAMLLPGQIRVIEQTAITALSAADRAAVIAANVVLYDRALAALVADVLPLGCYAEPLPADAAASALPSPRAVKFAADGWSVVQLIAAPGDRPARQRGTTTVSIPPGAGPRPAAAALAFTANGLAG
jgi:hypothetical protein